MVDERQQIYDQLLTLLGPAGLLHDAAARRVYSLDSSHLSLGLPWVVALPENAEQVAAVVGLCAQARVPVVCRGSGTGLSGGAVPGDGALVLATARLNGVDDFFPGQRCIVVQPGILNDQVSILATEHGLHFAPDPSSQAVATIGGNVAENAGGPHCLRYGVTLQHLKHLQWVDARGQSWSTGRGLPAERGFNLTSLLCGSEGTLGVVTQAHLNLVPNPESVITLLAFFPDLNDATISVVSLLTAGLQPVAVEMVDQAMLVAVEEAFAFGFATDVQGAMIAEFTGSSDEVLEDVQKAMVILKEGGAREIQQATSEADRLELWKCRKKAFGAVGRLAPHYVTMDVVVPLGRLPELVRQIQIIKTRHKVDIATAFHAGDGNLHPGIHYDHRVEGESERAHSAADEIIRTALEMDGSATGEHGVGLEKRHVLNWQLSRETMRLNRGIKQIFDPENILNPGKIFPDSDQELTPCKPLPEGVIFRWDSLSVTALANTPLAEIQEQALSRGLCLPVGSFCESESGSLGLGAATTVGDLVAQGIPGPGVLAMGTTGDFLLELWARTGDGHLFHSGAPVFKNVAGYGLGPCLCGSGRRYVEPLAATFQLKPICEAILTMAFSFEPLEKNARNNLESLLESIAVNDVASPTIIWDCKAGSLQLFIGGRNQRWGLENLKATMVKTASGFLLQESEIISPLALGEYLKSTRLPRWSQCSSEWTMWCRQAGNYLQHVPNFGDRWIWQSIPGLWWTPESDVQPGLIDVQPGISSSSWYGDPLLKDGHITEPPIPPGNVPTYILEKLKNLFDPEGVC